MSKCLHFAGRPGSGAASFSDVSGSAWYADAIAWAASNGIVSGIGNDMFAPEQNVTREQMAAMLYNYCTLKGISLSAGRGASSFVDNGNIHTWARDAVNAMYRAEILNGRDNNAFDPQGNATRAEVAQMLMNFMKAHK